MGNRLCRRRKKETTESQNPSLLLIKQAQEKYFHSHVESDTDDSDVMEESIDAMSTSQDSLDNLDIESGEAERWIEDRSNPLESACTLNQISTIGAQNDESNKSLDTTSEQNPVENRKGKKGRRAKYIRLSRRENFFSIFNEEDKKARSVDPRLYAYPFENIVFEGGGNKGIAYCGAVRLLEELELWPQVKRLAGTSAGAMTAALLAVGYDSHHLEEFFSLNLNQIFLDHKCGYLSLIPNLLRYYGWNPGKKIYEWMGEKIAAQTGNPDSTFKQVYQTFNRELCVVVTNLNQMTSLYCHPKTTPDMPVRLAVRMSISIPGMFRAVKHRTYGHTDVFVDGGVLCNYPIHCYDGWWLSMEPEDNFLERLQPLEDVPRLLERSERFGTYNEKTLGMQLYSDNEQDLLKYQLENLRHGVQLQDLPNTKLARAKIRKKKLQLKTDREHRRLVNAMNAFLRSLRHHAGGGDSIDHNELKEALQDERRFSNAKRLILFGDVSFDVILDYLDSDHDGQISYNELLNFMEDTGISMQNRFLGYQRRQIKNLPSFLDTLQATLLTNVKRVYVEERDLKRTVGINTGHVGTSDFVLEQDDIDFLIERGRRSLEAFLKYYVASNHLKKRRQRFPGEGRKNSQASLLSTGSAPSLDSVETRSVPESEASAPVQGHGKKSILTNKSVVISDVVNYIGHSNSQGDISEESNLSNSETSTLLDSETPNPLISEQLNFSNDDRSHLLKSEHSNTSKGEEIELATNSTGT
ncbi:uncharacterized protein LOC131943353 [Physella acuta]|uniref:uncharacterized protein LOC131943353 n=1 Tax=Physella acuta TaxID=109671 RepID=UPI0027DDF9BB|nr:uncharacterized protein LOC131943353 [Physella acuta]